MIEPIEPVLDLGSLTKDPGDPALQGYGPGHPQYYILGGRPLDPEEMAPRKTVNDEVWPRNPIEREVKIRAFLAAAEAKLEEDIASYNDLRQRGTEALTPFQRYMEYGLEKAFSLKYAHITYRLGLIEKYRGLLDAVQEEIVLGDFVFPRPVQQSLW